MRNRISIAMSGLGLLYTLLAAPLAAGESGHGATATQYWFCQSSTNAPAYSSRIVKTVASGADEYAISHAVDMTKRDIEKSFADFLAKKYGYAGLSSCISDASQFWTEGARNERLDTLRANRLEIIETDWTYTSDPSAARPAATTPPAAAAPAQYWTICFVQGETIRTDRGFRTTTYISGAVRTVPPHNDQDVGEAFARFIDESKLLPPGMHSSSRCAGMPSRAEAEALIRLHDSAPVPLGFPSLLDCTLWNRICVMTDWTSMPASPTADTTPRLPVVSPTQRPAPVAATPVPVKPAAPSTAIKPVTAAIIHAAQTPYAYCFGKVTGLAQTVYFGVPFEAPVQNIPAWSAAYKEFLRNKYKFAGLIHCPTRKTLAEARQQAQKSEDRYRARWKVIETGWKYQ